MFALLSGRLRSWVLFAILLPVARLISRRLAARIERKRGQSKATRVLHRAGNSGRRTR
ncbi:hypothetical protein [Sporichthya sp.]|uniref:hypothetical protein n=1 Tax=Sporichthya sp. TaxID=65475 RepID=UPI001857D6F1|nr:hypothetical protein [Sporichthya sp.]MBA3742685.1 hypothetical protein [Sporichthya sp.]